MKRIIPLLTTLLICSLLIVSVLLAIGVDRNPPTITIVQSLEHYIPTMSHGDLLAGVVATDDLDGDVTDTLSIEQIQILSDQSKANIIYVARDRKNNIAKKSILLKVEGIMEETKEVEEDADVVEVTATPVPEDLVAGETETEEQETVEGDDVRDEETSADGEASEDGEEEVAIEPLVSTGAPLIRLSSYEVIIEVGDRFNPLSYVAEAVDDKDDAWRRIAIRGEYSTRSEGVYTLAYSVTDRDGNESNVEELILTVR